MILDSSGRALKRRVGFIAAFDLAEVGKKGEIDVSAIGFEHYRIDPDFEAVAVAEAKEVIQDGL